MKMKVTQKETHIHSDSQTDKQIQRYIRDRYFDLQIDKCMIVDLDRDTS